jgi:membrane-bound lytic murein transglycosylase D
VEDLRAWNHLSSNHVRAGRTLYVAEPVHLAPSSRAGSRRGHAATARGRRGKGTARESARARTTTHGAHASRAASHTTHAKSTAHRRGSKGR